MNKLKAIVLLVISGILVIGSLVLILVNWASKATDFRRFWHGVPEIGLGLLLLLTAVGGVLVWVICRAAIPAGFRSLGAAQRAGREKESRQRLKELKDLQKQSKPAEPGPK
jgi:uncharacterized integral membrane protein